MLLFLKTVVNQGDNVDINRSWNVKAVVEVTIRYNTSQVVRSKCFMSEQQRMIERIKVRNLAFTKMIN